MRAALADLMPSLQYLPLRWRTDDATTLHHIVDPLLVFDCLDGGARAALACRQAAAGHITLIVLRPRWLCCHRRTAGNEGGRDRGKKQVVSIHSVKPPLRRLSGKAAIYTSQHRWTVLLFRACDQENKSVVRNALRHLPRDSKALIALEQTSTSRRVREHLNRSDCLARRTHKSVRYFAAQRSGNHKRVRIRE